MTRINTASITSQLQALGFSAAGAQQLITAQVLGLAHDRRRLALFLAGLFEGAAVQVAPPPGNRATMKTASGVIIELRDDSGGAGGGAWAAAASAAAAPGSTPVATRTASGVVISFDDDAG
jgi:hypothetical protein